MRRAVLPLLGSVCALALLLVCYRAVLFRNEQFAFRDSANFYYPLYLRVQQEWQAGRWPLWDPWRNCGQPLLAGPMAAALYPGKLVYALVPYPWAARLYVVGHTALAFCGLVALARSLGVSWVGAGLGGLSYAFGAPVLFQYNNVIYLVGAAWLAWGLWAAVRVVREGGRGGVAGLSAVLALQVVGGDPQAAYLTVVAGAGYAAVLAWRERPRRVRRARRPLALALTLALGLTAWVVATLVFAWTWPRLPGGLVPIEVPVLLAWVAAFAWLFRRGRRRPGDELGPRLTGLALAGALALAVSAAQVVPTAEFTALSSRTGENSPKAVSKFSVEPYRLAECAWPWFFGEEFPEHRSWIAALPPANDRQWWEPSLYVGGLALVLALGGAGFRGVPAWRAWLTAVAAVGLVASFGRFGSPLWWARWVPGLGQALGPHNPMFGDPRFDAYPDDVLGSPYALLGALLPGFGLFRYPSKLLTLTAAAAAVLAGVGWDEVASGRSGRVARASAAGLVASLVVLALAVALRDRAVEALSGRVRLDPYTGPPDIAGGWTVTWRALIHGAAVYAAGLVLAVWSPRRPGRAGALALLVLAVDLGLANSRLVWTVHQSVFDVTPAAALRIEAAERADPSPGPFRIHRLQFWHPERFLASHSPDRVRELVEWERATLQSDYAPPLGLGYCEASGVLELDDYLFFFRPQMLPARGETARSQGIPPGSPVYYVPRRSYDLWGARYFIMPVRPLGWNTAYRGFASLLAHTDVVHPLPDDLAAAGGRERWALDEDWQVVRNKAAYPRAWVVHSARVVPPAEDQAARGALMREILYQNDAIWTDPRRQVFDPRTTAWIETEFPDALRDYNTTGSVGPGEWVTVTRSEPQRVELKARLNRPGLVILADTFYPGWHLTIDDRPATILRANRLMRGAAVRAGEHTLVYDYDPLSFRVGLAVSALGLVALLGLTAVQVWRSRGRAPATGS
jgi:hypothetical protein